jgi:cholesterol transport system auxiliary component
MVRRFLLCMAAAAHALLTACAAPTGEVTRFDLGLPPTGAALEVQVTNARTLAQVDAPARLDSPAIVYRLAYDDASQVRAYAQSQWAAAPASLLSQRLRERLALAESARISHADDSLASNYLLRVELEEFSQIFDTPQTSHALVQACATLVDSRRHEVLAHHIFEVHRPAPSPDAPGAAHGLRDAVDQFIAELLHWMNQPRSGQVVLIGNDPILSDAACP